MEKRRSRPGILNCQKSYWNYYLMHLYQNIITVTEELTELSAVLKLLVDIAEELNQINPEYTDDICFDDIKPKFSSLNYIIYNWLKKGEKQRKTGFLKEQFKVKFEIKFIILKIFKSRKNSRRKLKDLG